MPRVAGELTIMIDVLHEFFEAEIGGLRSCLSPFPARYDHPGVERDTDDRVALHQRTKHIVTQLSLVRHKCPGVMMTGPNRSFENRQRLPEARIAQMREVED